MGYNDLKLSSGDAVALIAPASGQKYQEQHLLDQAQALLTDWGLNVVLVPDASEPQHYLSAPDPQRAKALITALTDDRIKAIFVTRGGYGCARLLPYLSDVTIPTPRFFVGFSDITTLHAHFYYEPNYRGVHGLNLATAQCFADTPSAANNRQALYDALFRQRFPRLNLTPLFKRGLAMDWQQAPLIGGCLSLLVTTLGTSAQWDTNGCGLIVEDIGESPYKIDRMLTHLRRGGYFDSIKALIIGEMVDCDSQQIMVTDVLCELFANDDFPVFLCTEIGHGAINLPWLYGQVGHYCLSSCDIN